MPLDDGTNKEGEDLSTPLPSDWKDQLEKIKISMYGTHASPATCKTRSLLCLSGIAFERCFGKKSDSSYRKFPVVVLSKEGEEKRQINDSHIIYKNLAPILFPSHGTPSEADIEIEKEVTFGLMLSCEKEAFASPDCMKRWAMTAGLGTGVSGFLVQNVAPLSITKNAADSLAQKHPHLKTPLEYCQNLKQALDQRGTPFFNGQSAGPLDASVYGAIAVWAPFGPNTKDYQKMPFMTQALNDSKLNEWYERVGEQIPNLWELHGTWPLYT